MQGFSDIGCYGSEIETPNIDGPASDGLRLLNHHTAAACSPTRAMLMSGTDAHLGGLGTLIEFKASEKGQRRFGGKAGYEGFLTQDVAALPEILADNGYFTTMSGKWHLGLRASQGPWKRGFQKSFAMLPGCCNHYGWEPVQEAFPIGGRPIHAEEGKKVDIPANKTEDPEGFYSTDYYTTRLLGFLEGRPNEEKNKPFFAYLPYTAPHWPLQCSKAQRDKYKGKYEDGPYALREKRLQKLVELGIIDKSVLPHKVETSTVGAGEWEDMTAEEKKLSSGAMEAYAGMVDTVDVNVGRVVEYVKKTGEYDNTFIVFMSDNGAEGASLEAIPVMGPNIKDAIFKYYDNEYDNIGAWNSFTWLGPLWAQASTAPSRLYKCFPSQGGILVPCVVKPPSTAFLSHFEPGTLNRSFSTIMDFAPTFLELAGITMPPATVKPSPGPLGDGTVVQRRMTQFRGRDVHAMRGKSWLPYFTATSNDDNITDDDNNGEMWAIHSSSEAVGWELHSRGALRKGDWKIVHIDKANGGAGTGDEGWELFNVVVDPGETRDRSAGEPAKLQELLACWDEYVVECGIVWGETAAVAGRSREEAPSLWEDETDLQKTWMGARGVTGHAYLVVVDPVILGVPNGFDAGTDFFAGRQGLGGYMLFCLPVPVKNTIQYAPVIFQDSVGISHNLSLLLAGFNGIAYFLFSLIPICIIDRVGRRNLMLACAGQGACMAVLAGTVHNGMPAEYLPLAIRTRAAALATASNWIFTFLGVEITPVSINSIGYKTYIYFCVFNFIFLPLVYFFYPETRNLSLEQIDLLFTGGKVKLYWDAIMGAMGETLEHDSDFSSAKIVPTERYETKEKPEVAYMM